MASLKRRPFFKIMKPPFLLATILLGSLAAPSLQAQQAATTTVVTTAAPALATKTALVTGLKEAQGLALDENGNILVAEYKAGQISRFSREGKSLGALITGLKARP